MSSVFVPQHVRGNKPAVTQETIQKLLDENSHLIQCIVDNQSAGNMRDASQYQQVLHRNLVWLATVADSNQSNAQNLLSQTSPKQHGASLVGQPPDVKAALAPPVSGPPASGSSQQVQSSPAAQTAPPQQTTPDNHAVNPVEPQQTPSSQMYSASQDQSAPPLQAKPQYAQQQQMPASYPAQYPPSGYPSSMAQRTPQDAAQAHPQQPPMQPQQALPAPQYSQQNMLHANPGMVSSAPGSYPASSSMSHQAQPQASYPMATSQGMQQQQYQMPQNQTMVSDQHRPQYGRPPPGQDPTGYPAYSQSPGQQMPAYPPQNQQPQNPDYSQYNNTEQQQMPYQQYQQQ